MSPDQPVLRGARRFGQYNRYLMFSIEKFANGLKVSETSMRKAGQNIQPFFNQTMRTAKECPELMKVNIHATR